jgi:hypothetical protein
LASTFNVQRSTFAVHRLAFAVHRLAFGFTVRWAQYGGIEDAWPTTIGYIKPAVVVQNMVETAVTKVELSIPDFLIRGFLPGAFFGIRNHLAFTAAKQTNSNITPRIFSVLRCQ